MTQRLKRRWTIKEDNYLWRHGPVQTKYQLAQQLNRSPLAIECRAKQKNISLKKQYNLWSAGEKHILKTMAKKGASLDDVAAVLINRSPQKIRNFCRDHHIRLTDNRIGKPNTYARQYSSRVISQVRQLHRQGVIIAEIQRRTGVSRRYIVSLIKNPSLRSDAL